MAAAACSPGLLAPKTGQCYLEGSLRTWISWIVTRSIGGPTCDEGGLSEQVTVLELVGGGGQGKVTTGNQPRAKSRELGSEMLGQHFS